MEVLLVIAGVCIYFGISVGKRNGLKYWLFDGVDGFGASIWVVFGAFVAAAGGWAILVGLAIVALASYALYDLTKRQVYSKKDLWLLLLGKISFAIVTFGIVMLIAILLGQKSKNFT
jgi:hypothetical protein